MLDIEIAAAAWAAGFDIATGNRSDFEPIAAAINDLAPGVRFDVVEAEVL
jgi:predicted nucleic acid-binding protein